MTVQHVSVSEGGQAIVGNVTQAPRENDLGKNASPALTDAQEVPMPKVNERKERALVRRRSKK